jgi:hypothetical protein
LGAFIPSACARSMAFWQMSRLVLEIWIDVDGGIGDDDRPLIGRHDKAETVADAPLGPEAGGAAPEPPQQLVGVQAALHHCVGFAGPHQRHRPLRGMVTVLRRLDPVGRNVDVFGVCDGLDFLSRPDQNRVDQLLLRRLNGCGQRIVAARVNNGGGQQWKTFAGADQLEIAVLAAQLDLWQLGHSLPDLRRRRDHLGRPRREDGSFVVAASARKNDGPVPGSSARFSVTSTVAVTVTP